VIFLVGCASKYNNLILRSVIGGYDPDDYMIYAKQP
jgi:hypothetical protein